MQSDRRKNKKDINKIWCMRAREKNSTPKKNDDDVGNDNSGDDVDERKSSKKTG